MLYGSCAWCTASEENVNRVSTLQKRVARIILDAKIRERSKLRFRRLDWLLRTEESNLKKLVEYLGASKKNCPKYITKLISNFERALQQFVPTCRF